MGDSRGEVGSFSLDGKEYLIIKTKEGKFRGGETHHDWQYGWVLSGEMYLFKGFDAGNMTRQLLKMGDHFTIGPEVIHYMQAWTDVLHVETVTNYVDQCSLNMTRHNRHYVPEIRDAISKSI